jgi:hypothetical protein
VGVKLEMFAHIRACRAACLHACAQMCYACMHMCVYVCVQVAYLLCVGGSACAARHIQPPIGKCILCLGWPSPHATATCWPMLGNRPTIQSNSRETLRATTPGNIAASGHEANAPSHCTNRCADAWPRMPVDEQVNHNRCLQL